MIFDDQKGATYVAASALTLGLLFASFSPARATDTSVVPAVAAASSAAPASPAPAATLSVTLVQDDLETAFTTSAKTVGDFLGERGIELEPDDYLSSPHDQALEDGMRIVYRPAVAVVVEVGNHRTSVRSSASTVADVLKDARVTVGAGDDVTPALDSRPLAHEIIRVSRISSWTGRIYQTISQRVMRRYDDSLPKGTSKTVDVGRPGSRLVEVRYVRRDDAPTTRSVVASRVVREPSPAIVAIGTGVADKYSSFAKAAQQSFASAVRFAGNAIHMIATAYTAGCYGCSGITALGMHAGLGVVAVDPHVIPLGTKLWIPGYGRAVAGDTGGAINGNRIDLGMDSIGDALRFGRRDVTVYVIR